MAPAPARRLTDRAAEIIAALVIAIVVSGQLLRFFGVDGPGSVLVFLACNFALSTSLTLLAGVRTPHLLALWSITTGPSILILAALPMALTGWWHPSAVSIAIQVLGVLAAAAVLMRSHDAPAARPGVVTSRSSVVLAVLGLAGFSLSCMVAWQHGHQQGIASRFGMAAEAGTLWFAGLGLVVLSLTISVVARRSLALPVMLVCAVVTVSQALMYGQPTVVVAARHLGLVDAAATLGYLDREAGIYQAWSGLFSGTAVATDAAGLTDLYRMAAWWGALAAPVMVVAVRALAGRFVDDRRAWLAGLVFGLGSSLTTSYFAPQVFGFVASLAILTLLVGWSEGSRRWLAARVGTVLLLSCSLAVSHQISPYLLFVGLCVLAHARLATPTWSPLLVIVPAGAWALLNVDVLGRYVTPSAFGDFFGNVAPPVHAPPAAGVPLDSRLAVLLPAGVLLLIGAVALVAVVRLRSRLAVALLVTAGSPALLLLVTDYGNEGVFRFALFSLPWLAVLVSRVVPTPVPPPAAPTRAAATASGPPWVRLLTAPVLLALIVVNVASLTLMDRARVVRPDAVAALGWFERTQPCGSWMLTVASGTSLPMFGTPRLDCMVYVSRDSLFQDDRVVYPTTSGRRYDAGADLDRLTRAFSAQDSPPGRRFAVIAPGEAAYAAAYGLQRVSDYDRLAHAIAQDPRWTWVFRSGGVTIYRLDDVAGSTTRPVEGQGAAVGPGAGPGQLLWSDQFDGSTLSSRWWTEGWFPRPGTRTSGPVNPSDDSCFWNGNVRQANGALHLRLTRRPVTCEGRRRPLAGAVVTSINRVYLRPGQRLTARIRLPDRAAARAGTRPAFWTDGDHAPADASTVGAIQVVELQRGRHCFNIHDSQSVSPPPTCTSAPAPSGWHVYGVTRDLANRLTFTRDGVVLGTRQLQTATRQYVVLGIDAGRTRTRQVAPAEMEVDWVRLARMPS